MRARPSDTLELFLSCIQNYYNPPSLGHRLGPDAGAPSLLPQTNYISRYLLVFQANSCLLGLSCSPQACLNLNFRVTILWLAKLELHHAYGCVLIWLIEIIVGRFIVLYVLIVGRPEGQDTALVLHCDSWRPLSNFGKKQHLAVLLPCNTVSLKEPAALHVPSSPTKFIRIQTGLVLRQS